MKDKFIREGDKGKIVLEVEDNLVLRTLQVSDVSEAYVNWMNDAEVVKYTEQRFSKHQRLNVEQFVEQKFRSNHDFLFGIFLQNRHIGNIKLGSIQWEHLNAEVSYLIGEKEFWGKGITTKAVKSVVGFGFCELGLNKINAGYYEVNIGSAKVLEKCGFVVEGIRERVIEVEGERRNSIAVGLTKIGSGCGL